MSFGQQSSESVSRRGLLPEQQYWASSQVPGLFGNVQQASQQAQTDPGGLQFQGAVNQLLPVGPYGVPTGATQGVMQLGQDLWSNASGARAARGGTSPYNLEGVLGDAVRMASPTLIPLATQTAFQRAAMAPQLRQSAFGYAMTPMQVISNLLSGTGESTSSSSGFGFDTQIGQMLRGAASAGAASGSNG